MSKRDAIRSLSLESLVDRCSQETQRFLERKGHDPRFCYELFRRACQAEEPERAWEILYRIYGRMVIRWVRRHPAFESSDEQAEYFQNRAFEKLWRALSGDRFVRFSDLKSILRYLQICVHSAVIDHHRKLRLDEFAVDPMEFPESQSDTELNPEQQALRAESRVEIWQAIQDRVSNPAELAVVFDNYALGLKSSEKLERHPELFDSVEDVYRAKQNLMARLRRDEELANSLIQNA